MTNIDNPSSLDQIYPRRMTKEERLKEIGESAARWAIELARQEGLIDDEDDLADEDMKHSDAVATEAMGGMMVEYGIRGGDVSDPRAYVKPIDEHLMREHEILKKEVFRAELVGHLEVLNKKGLEAFWENATTKQGALYIDLTNFKGVNDGISHERGDQLLIDVAGLLKKSVRKHDAVARVGGDEFVVLLSDETHELESDEIDEEDRDGARKEKSRDEALIGAQDRIARAVELFLRADKNKDIVNLPEGFLLAVGGAKYFEGAAIDDLIKLAEVDMKQHKKAQHDQVGKHKRTS